MISIPLVVTLILAQTSVISSSYSYCDFPEGATPYGPDNVCASYNRIECESSSYQAITQCYWNDGNGYCTSVAVATGEDNTCPYITNPTTCKKIRFLHNRHCVWYQAPTDQPSLFPSLGPTESPSTTPSDIPLTVPSRSPSLAPTPLPTPRPTRSPTRKPTRRPTRAPTPRPRPGPTSSPTAMPTANPSAVPTTTPSQIPSNNPSNIPTTSPSSHPSTHPSRSPTEVPSEEPTKYPSFAPSNVPTSNPSKSPSIPPSSTSFPTKTPVEKLVQVCHCNNELLCMDEPHVKGKELIICGWAQHPVVLEMIWFLQLSQYPILQTVVQDNLGGVDGGALFWSGDLTSFAVRMLVQDKFFERPSSGVVVNGRIRYSLSQRRRTDETIFVANDEEFTFRLEIPLEQPVSSGGVVAEATATDSDERDGKNSKNLRIWIPVAVAGAAAVGLLIFMLNVITTPRMTDEEDELMHAAVETSVVT